MIAIHAYLRASTDEQDANRAEADLEQFVAERGLRVHGWYMENESGTKLARPELARLMKKALEGDILLVEQVDRLSRLNAADWETLKQQLNERRIRVVALDLPTSWRALDPIQAGDDLTSTVLDAVNRMLLDMLAAVARKDYTDRRRRQAQGIEKAKAAGAYKGRQVDAKRHAVIAELLDKGLSWSKVCDATGASRSTVLRVVNLRKAAVEAAG